jgi:hypothetical protein
VKEYTVKSEKECKRLKIRKLKLNRWKSIEKKEISICKKVIKQGINYTKTGILIWYWLVHV